MGKWIPWLMALALLVVYGLAGEADRSDAVGYGAVRAEIVDSAPLWAVRE